MELSPLLAELGRYPFTRLDDWRAEAGRRGLEVIDFGVGDPREPTPAFIRAALAAAVNVTVQSSLQLWLGDLIEVAALEVSAEDSTLTVDLTYVVRQTQQRLTTRFTRGV